MKKILITGGAGYIGSILCTLLIEKNFKVTVLDNLSFSKTSLDHLLYHKNFNLIVGDTLDKKLLKSLIKKNEFIIPLASLVGAPLCAKKPVLAKKINLDILSFICDNLTNKNKIIFPTSNSGYGIGIKGKYCDETTPLNPISFYGKLKRDAEEIIRKKRNTISFRLATVFGFSYRMRTDLLVNNFVYKAIKDKKITLFEPHFIRNYIHVRDVANAFLFAINNFEKLKSQTYNLGLSSANISKLELAKLVKKFVPNFKIKINNFKKDPDQRDYLVSNRKIEKKGFKTSITLKDGISELVKILQKNKNQVIKNNY